MADGFDRDKAVRTAWIVGRLRYKLKPIQRKIIDLWMASKLKSPQFLGHIGRQTGKSFLWNLTAVELAIQNPGATIVVIAPVEKKLASFVKPILATILGDCPADLKPTFLEAKNQLVFSNGSIVHYFGSHNDNYNNIRGLGTVLYVLIDEAAFVSHLNELIAVVGPMLLRSRGYLIISSSSPETLDHEIVPMIEQAKMEGWYVMLPTWADETVTEDDLDRLGKLLGGRNSTRYRREVGCELIVEKSKQVLPEWDSEKYVKQLDKSPVYKFFHHFVSFDPGYQDPNAVLFGTYLFGEGKLYIEDEIVIPGKDITIDKLAAKIQAKVVELWPGSDRVSYWADPSNQTILDAMGKQYKLFFNWTAKDKKRQYLEQLRAFIAQDGLFLHPRCVVTRAMFENTIWKDDHTEFARSASGFHGDCIDAALYLYRNLILTNPVPLLNGVDLENNFIKSIRSMDETADIKKWISSDLDDAMQEDHTGQDQGDRW